MEDDHARPAPGRPPGDPGQPFPVHQEHPGFAVVERVRELVLGPPGVERYGDQAGQLGGPEGDLPLGVVPHRDDGPVPGRSPYTSVIRQASAEAAAKNSAYE